jgi:hypothetical protein
MKSTDTCPGREDVFAEACEQFQALLEQLEGEDTAELEHGEAEALLETQGRELLRGCEKIACPRGETQFWGKAEDVPVAKPQGSETGRTGSTANRIGLTAEVGLRLSARR